jgi:hypothetical protein
MALSTVDAAAAAGGPMIRHCASSILRVSPAVQYKSIQVTIERSPRFQNICKESKKGMKIIISDN